MRTSPVALLLFASATTPALAAAPAVVEPADPVAAEVSTDSDAEAVLHRGQAVMEKASAWLAAQQQEDGTFQPNPRMPPAVTALAAEVLAQDPTIGPDADAVRRATQSLLTLQQDDGGFYTNTLATYNTAIIVSCLETLDDPALQQPLERAIAFLKRGQFAGEMPNGNVQESDPAYGGWGYGGRSRADLSNTSVVLEALTDAGIPNDDPAYQRAVTFISRLQNNSETNPAAWAGDDGGFIYTPGRDGSGESSAGEFTTADGQRRLRSYGGMTYAGLKSMLYAGLAKDDPRVQAAWEWVQNNWTLKENPGMAFGPDAGPDAGEDGLYFYYHTLARALAAYGEPILTDASGVTHDWRIELINELASRQREDGSFVGTNKWMESQPLIATTLGTLALQEAMRDLQQHPAVAPTENAAD